MSRGSLYLECPASTFGQGTVSDVTAMGPNTRVVIDFAKAGRKTLILEYARLTILA